MSETIVNQYPQVYAFSADKITRIKIAPATIVRVKPVGIPTKDKPDLEEVRTTSLSSGEALTLKSAGIYEKDGRYTLYVVYEVDQNRSAFEGEFSAIPLDTEPVDRTIVQDPSTELSFIVSKGKAGSDVPWNIEIVTES